MPDTDVVSTHYAHGRLLEAITDGVRKLGKTPQTVSVDDLGPVDEFHIGGRAATENVLDQVGVSGEDHVLDVGCGLGGASRFTAMRYGARVTGVDLTHEFVDTGRTLCEWVGLTDRVTLEHGDATTTPFSDGSFDKAYMLHVGMNIADKAALAREVHRVLRPGAVFGIYDVMSTGGGDLTFPVPWAESADGSAVESPEAYAAMLEAAGFRVTTIRDRRDFALDFFATLRAANAATSGPPPLGLHILMGESAKTKIGNMIDNISNETIAPVEMIASKPD